METGDSIDSTYWALHRRQWAMALPGPCFAQDSSPTLHWCLVSLRKRTVNSYTWHWESCMGGSGGLAFNSYAATDPTNFVALSRLHTSGSVFLSVK